MGTNVASAKKINKIDIQIPQTNPVRKKVTKEFSSDDVIVNLNAGNVQNL